jgi:hypothetical protein
MTITFGELPGWNFAVDETSAGVYKAYGTDEAGHSVEVVGIDPEALLEECKEYAARIDTGDRSSEDSRSCSLTFRGS